MNDNDHVLAAAMAVMRAREARDSAGLEALLSPEFVLRMPGDDDLGRQQCVDAVRAIPGEIVSVRGQKMKAARIGEIGVATGIQVATVRIDGTTIESRTAFADLFQKADDGWQLVFAFSVELPAADNEGEDRAGRRQVVDALTARPDSRRDSA